MPSLVNTTVNHQQKELNMFERSTCSCYSPRENQHPTQWQQRCHELHHGFLCVHCHEHNVKGGYP
jgi:hypothetical protein